MYIGMAKLVFMFYNIKFRNVTNIGNWKYDDDYDNINKCFLKHANKE